MFCDRFKWFENVFRKVIENNTKREMFSVSREISKRIDRDVPSVQIFPTFDSPFV